MQNIEYEVKVLNIIPDEIKEKLIKIGAIFVSKKYFKRYIFDLNDGNGSKWIRLRTDGETTTLCVKEILNNEIGGVKEYEVIVSDFDETFKLLETLGYKHRSYQENYRETYFFETITFDIDTWPLIKPYIEIEGRNEEDVQKGLKLLYLEGKQFKSNSVEAIYKSYGIDIKQIKNLTFSK